MNELYETRVSGEVSEVDMLNFSTSSNAYKDSIGMPVKKAVGLAITQTVDTDGKETNASYIIFEDGTIVGGVSSVILKAVIGAMDLMDKGVELHATIEKGLSNGDRNFCKVVWS